MDFQLLQARLITEIRARVRNGEMTERGLARITGISQPHIHNVLKGARCLSLGGADRILSRLRIDLAELVANSGGEVGACRMVTLLDGYIGSAHPYPLGVGQARHPFPLAAVARLGDPVAVRLAPDRLSAPAFEAGGVILLDRSAGLRVGPDEEAYFALDLGDAGGIGMLRARHPLCVFARDSGHWEPIALSGRNPLDLIRGRISLLLRQL